MSGAPMALRAPWGRRRRHVLPVASVGVGLLGIATVSLQPKVAVVLPAVLLSALAAHRRPAWMLGAMLFVAAFFGALTAVTQASVSLRLPIELILVGLAVSVGWSYLRGGTRPPVRFWPPVVALVAYLFITFLSMPFAASLFIGTEAFRRAPLFLLAFLVMGYGRWSAEVRWSMAKAVVLVCLVAGAYAMLRYVTGPSAQELALSNQTYGVVNGDVALFGSFVGRQDLGGWMAASLPVVASLGIVMRGRWRVACLLSGVFAVIAIFACNTRVALVAAGAGLVLGAVLLLAARAAARRRVGIAIILAGTLALGLGAYSLTVGGSPQNSARYANIVHPERDGSASNHLTKWRATIRDTRSHPLGYGLGSAGSVSQEFGRFVNADTFSIDNSYLSVSYQQGFPMLGLYAASLLGIVLWLGSAAVLTADPRQLALAVAGCGALAAWLVTMTTAIFIERWVALFALAVVGLAANPFLTRRSLDETS